jgi:hypothetical protein
MTTSTTIQTSPYLREQFQFPSTDLKTLAVQVDHIYLDIAQKVNSRTIGIFPVNFNAITGESWYLSGSSQKQQTLRQVYQFTSVGSIAHGLNFADIAGFTRIYGAITNGSNWYPLPYVDVNAANNQVNVIVTPTNILISAGGGAPPAITSGWVVLEWLSIY